MSMKRCIITISENGVVSMPTAPVWMTQFEIVDLFGVFGVFSCDVRKAIHSIYKNKELNEVDTMKYVRQPDGISYDVYNLENGCRRCVQDMQPRKYPVQKVCSK